jgi:hypothetical protein
MGRVGHEQQRGRQVARNYRAREHGSWHKGIDSDRIDKKALTDSTLTARENKRLLNDLYKNYMR